MKNRLPSQGFLLMGILPASETARAQEALLPEDEAGPMRTKRVQRFGTGLALAVALGMLSACEPVPETVPADSDPGAKLDSRGEASDAAAWSETEDASLPSTAFAAPEGLAVAGDFLVVANSHYGYDANGIYYGAGFVTIVDRIGRTVANRIPLPARNPQVVQTADDRVWVLCSGVTTFDGENVLPLSDGALVGISVDRLADAMEPDVVIPIGRNAAHPLVGYPSSLVLTGGRAWIASGTVAAAFVVDLDLETLVRGPDDPVVLGDLDVQDTMSLSPGPDGRLLAGSFNRDRVFVLDPTTATPIDDMTFEVGVDGMMDGVLSLAWRDGSQPNVFVLLGLANRVAAATLGVGTPDVIQRFAVTGSIPNAIMVHGDRLLVLNSGDNNVTAFDAVTGAALDFRATCPLSSNPYAMALGERDGRQELYLTGLLANAVYVFDAQSGERLAVIP